jgi:putative Mg2+ transporter-C (MgtC) family protein
MDLIEAYWSPEEVAVSAVVLLQMLGALAAGIVIGYERSYHGRAAGMRTFAVVCMATALLTAVSAFPGQWFGGLASAPMASADPTRIIQGLMTGIGFLGAGVIMREGFSIRGLSTAAAIWITAAIGVTIGLGLFGAAMAATLLTIIVMSGIRRLETVLPHYKVLRLSLVFAREHALLADAVHGMMHDLGFLVADLSCALSSNGTRFEYHMVLKCTGNRGFNELMESLSKAENVLEFRLAPERD